MEFDQLFVEPMGREQEAFLNGEIRQQRIRLLIQATREASSAMIQAQPLHPLNAYLRALESLLRSYPERGMELVDHWQTAFFLPMLQQPTLGNAALARLMVPLLFEKLKDGSSPVQGIDFLSKADDSGALYALAMDGRVRLRRLAEPDAQIIWQCARNSASVQTQVDAKGGVEVGLPLSVGESDNDVEYLPFCRTEWGVPLIQNGKAALLLEDDPSAFKVPLERTDAFGAQALPLSASLAQAYQIMEEFWPEVISWAKTLIPAFVEIDAPANRNTRLSGSFGPGVPIYLSRVTDPFCHAEDIVHELQHQRFQLLVAADRDFGEWSGSQRVFVSPYRPDPRPLRGIHLGLHAFVAVNKLRLRAWNRIMSQNKIFEMLTTHRRNLFSFRSILACEQMSARGRQFYAQVGRALSDHNRAIEPLASASMKRRVEDALRDHVAGVAARDAGVENYTISCGPGVTKELLQMDTAILEGKGEVEHEDRGKTL
jgi:HEXXH motif-containing protein